MIAQSEENARLLRAKALPPQQTVVGMGVPTVYFYDLASRNEIAYAQKLGRPILILHGARDYQAVDDDIRVWRKGLSGVPRISMFKLALPIASIIHLKHISPNFVP